MSWADDPELVATFRAEVEERLASLCEGLLRLEAHPSPRQLVAGPMFAHRLLYAADCPVMTMPPRLSGEPPSTLTRMAGALGRGVVAAAGTAGRPGYRPPPRS